MEKVFEDFVIDHVDCLVPELQKRGFDDYTSSVDCFDASCVTLSFKFTSRYGADFD